MPPQGDVVRLTLAYKIFGAFLLTSLIVIVLMTGITRYFAERHFMEYINRVESEVLTELVDIFGAAFREHQGWEFLSEDPGAFRDLTRTILSRGQESLPAPSPSPGDSRNTIRDDGPQDPPPPRSLQYRVVQRVSLFDDRMQVVQGSATSTDDHILKAIEIDGTTVGWLGLAKRQPSSGSREKAFLREQTKALAVIGFLALVLAALVSYLLSRHLLKPIEQLTRGAHALASRKFNARIEVFSGDELGQLADDFNTMAQTLEHYEQLRRQWLSDIAHELRTPVAILRGEIEAILDGVREASTKTLESIHAEVMLLGKLIGDLHELSIAETGELSMEKEPVKVLRVLKNTLRLFESRFAEKDIAIELDLGSDLDTSVMADSDRLAQVFSNVLENSLRYTESPGTIRVWNMVAPGFLHVFIEDSKPGVSDYDLDHLLVQGYEFEGYDRTIDTHIKNLRKKIASIMPDTEIISSVYGEGYKFTAR